MKLKYLFLDVHTQSVKSGQAAKTDMYSPRLEACEIFKTVITIIKSENGRYCLALCPPVCVKCSI